jgi:hypothetical protein
MRRDHEVESLRRYDDSGGTLDPQVSVRQSISENCTGRCMHVQRGFVAGQHEASLTTSTRLRPVKHPSHMNIYHYW